MTADACDTAGHRIDPISRCESGDVAGRLLDGSGQIDAEHGGRLGLSVGGQYGAFMVSGMVAG
jgi:hypothetical protein